MRFWTASALGALMLASCGQSQSNADQEPEARQSPIETESRRPRESFDEFDRERYTPLEGEIAFNDEYAISAIFPKEHPVCRADSGGHIHGFYEWLDGDCSEGLWGKKSARFISIWADYNAMEYSWSGAPGEYCGEDTAPVDLGVIARNGRLSACRTKAPAANSEFTIVYLADDPTQDLFKPEDGPELIYTIRLGTTPRTETADLQALRTFLAKVKLANGSLKLANP